MRDRPQWSRQAALWRDPAQAVSLHRAGAAVSREMLAGKVKGDFWGLIEQLGVTLMVGREYEHVVMALAARGGRPHVTYMPLPHPTGIAVDAKRGTVFIASTRNPNQIYTFRPLAGLLPRKDRAPSQPDDNPLMPAASQILPGSLYIHDLALIGGKLHASAAGHNAIVRIDRDGFTPVWWPHSIERRGKPDFGRNYLQLNSIAAGASLDTSFFTASSESIGARFPGDPDFPVDGRGVVFSGATREPVVRGLTRPHSARLFRRKLYVPNSGYGEFGVTGGGRFTPVTTLPGWTRGLAFKDGYAFVGVSRVIPRFRAYAPGLDVSKSACGVFAVELKTGNVVASIVWPSGNQIFAVELLPSRMTSGFPYRAAPGRDETARLEALFYAFRISGTST
jgi:uncharacterized protein (TIGR03032 family)